MPLKMIIADDEPKTQYELNQWFKLSTRDIEVKGIARNGTDLIQRCRDQKPDICLVDISMPQLGGIEVIDKIRNLLPEAKLIIVSSREDLESAGQLVAGGVAAYMLKPVDDKTMIHTVRKISEIIRKNRSSKILYEPGYGNLREEKALMFEPFVHKILLHQYSPEDLKYMLQELNLQGKGPHSLLLINHPAFEVNSAKISDTKENVSALHRALGKVLNIDKEILWASITPRRSLCIVKNTSDEVIRRIPKLTLESAGKKLGIELHLVSGTIQSFEDEFQTVYSELSEILDNEMKVSPVIKTVINLLENEFMNKKLSLNMVAKDLHISPQYLSRMFKNEIGMSFSEYLIQTRISNAIQLMLSTNASIFEISDSVGYRSQHYFSTAFKKVTNSCPKAYRVKQENL